MPKFLIHVKREFWECRASFVRTPFVTAVIMMVLLLSGMVPFQSKIGSFLENARIEHHDEVQKGAQFVEGLGVDPTSGVPEYLIHGMGAIYSLFVFVLLIVLVFYFVDALYSDRRDQSILFWKSLPVSERTTVLAKLVAGTAGAPLFYAAAALATGVFYVLVFMVYAKVFWGLPVPGLGAVIAAIFTSAMGLILGWWFLVLWFLPLFGWLLFSSAVARKTPFLIALGVPLGLMVLEVWVLGTGHLLGVLKNQVIAGLFHFQSLLRHPEAMGENLVSTFSSTQLWVGLVISAGFLTASTWLRHNRWEV